MISTSDVRRVRRRISRAVDRHGLIGTVRLAAHRDEISIWYEVVLDDRPRIALREGRLLAASGGEALERFNEICANEPATTRLRLQDGGRPWVLLVDGEPAFACWLFAHRTPINSMPGEWLELPDGVICLEDSVTGPAFRGRGLAPGAWSSLMDLLQEEGARSLITNVLCSNEPSTRAVKKVGFEPVAAMRYVRVGPRSRQNMRAFAAGTGPAIAADLDGRTYLSPRIRRPR